MSTPLMPELPPINAKDCIPYDLIRYLPGYPEIYVQKYAEAYGLAVWKAAIQAAGEIANQNADKVRKTNTFRGRMSAATSFCIDQCEQIGMEIRSLPDPVIQQARLGSS